MKLDKHEKHLVESRKKMVVVYDLELKKMLRYIRHYNHITALTIGLDEQIVIGDTMGKV
jgi:hypothetical protein